MGDVRIEANYEDCSVAYNIIRRKTTLAPKVGIVCGSGLGSIGDIVENGVDIGYAELPGFHVSHVPGHKSKLLLGQINGIDVVCMQGRFHGYEGISYSKCAFPIRVMKLLGVEKLIVTNAAGGLNKSFELGDFMILRDHLPVALWACNNPLVGPNEAKFGPRFIPTSNAYDKSLATLVKDSAKELGLEKGIKQGCYAMMAGPNYESVAECRMLLNLGADAVGMSTVPEVLVAHHCGIKSIGISMITNLAVTDYDSEEAANHEEVIEMAKMRAGDMVELVKKVIEKL